METFQDRICDNRHGAVPHHTVRLAALQVPDGQLTLLLIDRQHGVDEIIDPFGLDKRHQRIKRPIGIPEGEDRIIIKGGMPIDFAIRSAVTAIMIVIEGWRDHGMIEGGVKYFALYRVSGLNLDLAESLL